MEMFIIPTEKIASFQADLKKWQSKQEAKLQLKVCMKTLDNYLAKGILHMYKKGKKSYPKERISYTFLC
jgi:hypothetical protein